MSWLISSALMKAYENSRCLQEPAAESSEATCSDGEQLQPSSVINMPQAYCARDRMTAFSRLSRYGMTLGLLMDDRGADLLTWYLADSRVRTSALQGQGKDSTASAVGCGRTLPASLARYDRDSHTLKTAQLSFLEDSTAFSATLPRSGTMRNGECFQQPTLARLTLGSESGLWPTPAVCGNYNRKGLSKTSGDGLATAVAKAMWPTPTATMNKGWSPGHNRADSDDRIDYTVEREAKEAGQSGRLNPEWVEWLMGWPLGHTDLKLLETARFHEWLHQHSFN